MFDLVLDLHPWITGPSSTRSLCMSTRLSIYVEAHGNRSAAVSPGVELGRPPS